MLMGKRILPGDSGGGYYPAYDAEFVRDSSDAV
jgi:hypothetical protein